MKSVAMMFLVGAVLGLVMVQATVAEQATAATLSGTVVKVEDGKVTVKAYDKEVVVATDDKTAVTVDGKEAKVADLKAGMAVVVTPAEGTAAKIEATTPKVKAPKTEK